MELFDVYSLFNVTPVRARDCTVWDDQGQEYLDLYGGHAVISVGHSHPHYVEALKLYQDYYAGAAFTFVSDRPVDLKQVVNTNKAIVAPEVHGGTLVVSSVIDNLLKGASGQAVQNMNLIFGIPETTGLKLKASAF